MIGTSLGPYKIIEQLGAGGMGEVYLGEDTRLGRKVAIKVLPAEFASDPERLARFEQEARAAAALNHAHIAVVHAIGTEGRDFDAQMVLRHVATLEGHRQPRQCRSESGCAARHIADRVGKVHPPALALICADP